MPRHVLPLRQPRPLFLLVVFPGSTLRWKCCWEHAPHMLLHVVLYCKGLMASPSHAHSPKAFNATRALERLTHEAPDDAVSIFCHSTSHTVSVSLMSPAYKPVRLRIRRYRSQNNVPLLWRA